MKSVFITGLAGMLGSNFAYLMRDKYKIFGIDKNPVNIEGVYCELGSALDTVMVEEMIKENNIDTFIHCAALVNVDLCETKPDYAEIVNYQMCDTLHKICQRNNVKFIFISSDAVYEGTKLGLNKESDAVNPVSVYGKTKLMAENSVMKNKKSLVIRTNMYGFNYREKNSFAEWVVQALHSDEALNMFYDITFSPIIVNRLVEIIDMCIEKDVCGLYNIGCTGMISKFDLGVEIQKAFRIPGVIRRESMEEHCFLAPRTKNMGLDNAEIKKLLNIEINTPIQDVLEFKRLWDEGYGKKLKQGKYIKNSEVSCE